ncbi:MAG: hypothetical protein IJ276_00060 [Alphaproteobacteria bacterium]|nr:hypothetical protein [Alphaproteobacteria bacterium]
MLKKLLAVVFGAFFAFAAHAGRIANVEYIHNLIANRIGVEVPYNANLRNPRQVANMEYLLTAVDVANEILNGEATSKYGAGEYATNQIADIAVTEHAVNELVYEEWPFSVTTTENAESFGFILGAAGTFMVDWGDGTIETIVRDNTEFMPYNHSYATPGKYVVRFGGRATGYAYMDVDPIINSLQRFIVDFDEHAFDNLQIAPEGITISFVTDSDRIAHIDGSLGSVFPTLENGDNPSFLLTFAGATNWDGIIPERLFSRVYGQPSPLMFTGTFAASNLKSVPEKLFAGLTGHPSYAMNTGTFLLTPFVEGSIPAKLYANLRGAPERGAFLGTFALSGFKGELPSTLFSGLKGQAKEAAFALTFAGMPYLEGRIPAKLFAGISGRPMAAQYLGTFAGSGIDVLALIEGGDLSIDVIKGNGLTGTIPESLFGNLNGAPGELAFAGTFGASFGLSGTIPEDLFKGVKGAPAPGMFLGTFAGCTQLSGEIPGGLFRNLEGAPALGMFGFTFIEDDRLSGIGDGLFAGIEGSAELGMFFYTFFSMSDLAGPSAKGKGGKYLYEIWPDALTYSYMYSNKLDDYATIPENWGGLGQTGLGEPKFIATTTPDTTSFEFRLNALGVFGVDWGDGTFDTVTQDMLEEFVFSHKYDKAGEYKIKISGEAIGYPSGATIPTISFESNYNLAKIEGSFRELFPVMPSVVGVLIPSPNFYRTFYNCKNLKGEIPEQLFPRNMLAMGGIDGESKKFYQTFMGCSGLTGSIPADLFEDLYAQPSGELFRETFKGCSGLTGTIPATLFARIQGVPSYGMFMGTFEGCSGLTGTIPATLFSGIKGAPAQDMFTRTFADCTGLEGPIPADLFAGIEGTPAPYMFEQTFWGCTGLTGEIPADLFAGISGTAATDMFYGTFGRCTSLSGTSAQTGEQYLYNIWDPSYMKTMYCGDTQLEDVANIPADMTACEDVSDVDFSDWAFETATTNVSSMTVYLAAAGKYYISWGDGKVDVIEKTDASRTSHSHSYRRANTYTIKMGGLATAYNTDDELATISFSYTGSLTKLSGSLGAIFPTLADGSQPSFYQTFYGAYNIYGEIPADLFAGISGQPRAYMFYRTFNGCSGLSGEIPADLFAGISGQPRAYMFSQTFYGCNRLSGIGGALFAGISGTPAQYMFYQTFYNCSGLTGEIPANFIGALSGNAATNMFAYMFGNCRNLTGNTVRAGGEYLYNIWPDATTDQIGGVYEGAVGLTGMRCGSDDQVPLSWGGPVCLDYWPLELTTTNTYSYSFNIAATGTFYVDWGDGYTQVITKTDTSRTYYSHSYNKSGVYTVKLAGLATAYNTSYSTPAISFSTATAGVKGSLGEIFPTLSNGSQPSFYQTFYGCSSLKGEIPATLFNGISGAPRTYMFYQTFYNCSGLTGEIPAGLFAGISGAPASYMFYQTFYNCSGLTGIGGPLFAGISGAPATYMFYQTFYNCSGLEEAELSGMFGTLNGAPATYMFYQTFFGCQNMKGDISNVFAGTLSGSAASNMFVQTFQGCSGLTGTSVKSGGKFLYEIWPNATSAQVGDMYTGCTGLTDNNCETGVMIPAIWGAQACVDDWAFEYTTNNTSDVTISLSAMGTFYVDWGDGSSSVIERTDTSLKSYNHVYAKSAAYNVKVAGLATAYSTNDKTATVKFTRVASVTGQLGSVFPTLADGSQPSFYQTFADASLKTIPADLFAGVKGAPRPYMFYQTFEGNYNLTEVPENLFTSISGAPVEHLFNGTFYGCSNLKSVPENLFASISGAPADSLFYQTFYGCYNLATLPAGLFASISGAPAANMFKQTFYDCDRLTVVPAGLFAGISGAPASSMFEATFSNCNGLMTLPEGLFANVQGAPVQNMFKQTFQACASLKAIPADLFAGISGAPAKYMFDSTFSGCSSLTAIPEELFAGVKGDAADYMLQNVFNNCSKLAAIPEGLFAGITGEPTKSMFKNAFTGTAIKSIPEGLFAGIEGAPAANMFQDTFNNCDNLVTVPAGLFAGISGLPAQYMFEGAFEGCDNLTTIPEDLFAGLSGKPAKYMFANTFSGCKKLTAVPEDLFAGISGAPASNMFDYTFSGCSNLQTVPADLFAGITGKPVSNMFMYTFASSGLTAIPEGLFAGISGAPAQNMFEGTFNNCDGLTTIPAGLFAGIKGTPAKYMFYNTFNDCDNLTTIPENLFGGLSGAPAYEMFWNTFYSCDKLAAIPENLFGNISGSSASYMFDYTFANCPALRGPSAKINGKYLYQIWPSAGVQYTYRGSTGLTDYSSIPSYWK